MRFGRSRHPDEWSAVGGPGRKPRQCGRYPARCPYLCREQRDLGSKAGRRSENRSPARMTAGATFFGKAIEHLQIAFTLEPWTMRSHRRQVGGIPHPLPLLKKSRKQPPGIFLLISITCDFGGVLEHLRPPQIRRRPEGLH